jgi:3-hydroxy-9,10-secoandrosta-1,3,5(10)-triene-9,17-dione monooxygenase
MARISGDEWLQRARSLVPACRERSAEAARRIAEITLRELHELGLCRVNQPRWVGRAEVDVSLLVEITGILASGCASTGWVFINQAVDHWMLAMWPPKGQAAVWDQDPDALIASSVIYPLGRAESVLAGYRLTGRWPFFSGVHHSGWTILGALVESSDGPEAPEPRMFLVPTGDIDVLDTWDVAGLAATGSHDVECEELFVATAMTLAARDTRGDPTPGAVLNPAPLYGQCVVSLFPHMIAGVLLGISEGAYEICLAQMRERSARSSSARLAAARQLLLSNFCELEAIAEAGKMPSVEDKLRWHRMVPSSPPWWVKRAIASSGWRERTRSSMPIPCSV